MEKLAKTLQNLVDFLKKAKDEHARQMAGSEKMKWDKAEKAEKNPCQCHDCVQFGLSKHPTPKPVKMSKGGQWSLEPDEIKPGKENSRKLPKEEK